MKIRHIVEGRTYYDSTECYVVFAYCGAEQEASGSGKHSLDVGDAPCEKCWRAFTVATSDDRDEDRVADAIEKIAERMEKAQ